MVVYLNATASAMNKTVCNKCGHGMMMHGCVDGVGYCMEGNGDWCKCTVKGKTYEEEIEMLKNEGII
tara:strand:+ start:332 stop:532 length:201 start_codon:yes stop_codon:yes gene_type:complete